MDRSEVLCRVAACPEQLGDGNEWSIYVLNDGSVPFDRVVLTTFGHEWGDMGLAVHPNVELSCVAPGVGARIWRDNDDELRMWLTMTVQIDGTESELLAEFPLLYRRKSDLPIVDGLGKPGWVVSGVVFRQTS